MNQRLLLLALSLIVSCAPPSAPISYHDNPIEGPAPGTVVSLQFRRDALGAAANLPVPPTSDSHNGAPVSIQGKLVTITDDWIGLDRDSRRHWIPRETVLMLIEAGS